MTHASRGPRAILLCAGASSRLGEPKALAELGGQSVLARLLTAARAVDREPLVITGRDHAVIAAAARDLGCLAIRNERWAEGRTGSVLTGSAARAGEDLLVMPADVPLVTGDTVRALASSWLEAGAPPRGWLAPRVVDRGGRVLFGHPVLIGRDLCAHELPGLPPDAGLKTLRGLAEPLLSREVTDAAILDDLDTPADLEALRARFRG
ncbi:MAG: NTP transferase domain-containing protein [Planctomycetota bacterium]|nr:NTP transferase domain-containing protein [Planctomycetota bacterium]MEC8510588.1 NTP transferase domain-containing protein [Planctomycetota bacterium]